MRTSESIAALAAALAKAQAKIEGAEKNKTNPAFRSKYADLAAVWDACREPLATNGLSVVQAPTSDGPKLTVTTRLMHTSGEWIEDQLTMVAKDASPQSLMSCLTYARRGALAAFVGVAPEDDDGEAAQGRGEHVDKRTGEIHEPAKPQPKPAPKPVEAAPTDAKPAPLKKGSISEAQQKRLFAIAKGAGWSTDDMKTALRVKFGVAHTSEINWSAYDRICDYFKQAPDEIVEDAAEAEYQAQLAEPPLDPDDTPF